MTKYLYVLLLGLLSNISFSQSCSDLTELSGCLGSFDDGSGSGIYSTNLDCQWHIHNDSSQQIFLSFEEVDIEWGVDIIKVYDGKDVNAPLIRQLLNPNDNSVFISNGPDLFVTFTSDNSVSLQGWIGNYSCIDEPIPNFTVVNELSDISFLNDSLYFTTVIAITNYIGNSIEISYEIIIDPAASISNILSVEDIDFKSNVDTLLVQRVFSFDELNLPYGVYTIVTEANPSRVLQETKFNDNRFEKDMQSIDYCGGLAYRTCSDTLVIKSDLNSGQIVSASCIYEIIPSNLNAKHIELKIDEIELEEGQVLKINYKQRDADFYRNLKSWNKENLSTTTFITPGPLVQVVLNSFEERPVNIKIPYQCIEEELVDAVGSLTVTADDNNLGCRISVTNVSSYRIDNLRMVIGLIKLENGIPSSVEKRITDNFLFGFVAPLGFTSKAINVGFSHLDLTPGEYLIYVDLDPENLIREIDESNNRFVSNTNLVIPYCRLGNVIDECSGVITDGSGDEYTNIESGCSWTIKSDEVEHYVINFTDFDFSDEGSKINIYDSGIMYNELIASFNYRNLPYPIASSTGEIKVKFENYTDVEEEGWELEFICEKTKRHNFNYGYEYLAYTPFNDLINIEAEIKNASSLPIDDVKIGCYLSKDKDLTPDDFKFYETSLGAFDPAESKYFEFTELLKPYSDGLEPGHYYYGFIIDPDNEYDELLESDNSLVSLGTVGVGYCNGYNFFRDCTGTVSDGSGSDSYLANSWCDFYIQPNYGDEIDLEFSSLNWDSPNDSLTIYDSRFQFSGFTTVINGNDTPESIGVIASSGKSMSLSWRTGDSNPDPSEGWELQYVCRTDRPNLLVRPDGPLENLNKEITLSYLLKNDSGHSTNGFDVNYVLSTHRFLLPSSIVIDTETISSMDGPENQNRRVTLNLEPFLDEIWAGYKYIGVVVDPNRDIDEMEESDNYFFYQEAIDVLVPTEEIDLSSFLKVFPNPSSDVLNVEWSSQNRFDFQSIQVVNVLGVEMYTSTLPIHDERHIIDLSAWPVGVYAVQLLGNGHSARKTFIKVQ